MAVLRLVPLTGAPIEVDKEQAIVGRDPASDVPINDGSVSRRHARLERRGSAWFVVDQGSANGTYLDSQRVSDALLRQGQVLRFGAVAFKVELVGDAPSFDGTMLTTSGALGQPPAPPAAPRPAVPPPPVAPPPGAPPQWPAAPPAPQWPAAPPPPMPGPRPPAPQAPPQPPYAAPPAPPRAGGPPPPPPAPEGGAPARRPRPPRPAAEAGEAPPVKQGRGPLFWTGIGCGGCLVAVLLAVGAFLAFLYFSTKGPRDTATEHLRDIRSGNLEAAYDDLSAGYRQQVSRENFAAFVSRHPALQAFDDFSFRSVSSEGSRAAVGGYVNSAKGDRETATYALVKEDGGWKISAIEVGADHPEAQPVGEAPAGVRIDLLQAEKRSDGNTIEVRVAMTVAGFDVRPEGGQYGIDLGVDVETIGPDGARVEALSRDDVQRFQRTTSMERGAVAPINVPLIVDRSLPPGSYTVRVRVRDRVGGGQAARETQVALP